MRYKIKKEQSGTRLDLFLAGKDKAKSRSQIQRDIADGLVSVDGASRASHYALKEGEVVETVKGRKENKKNKIDFDIRVVFENDDFLVVDKPAGLIVHGAPHIKEATLADWLVAKYPKIEKVGEDELRPGIMHRLDKEASGLLVIAKNNETFFHLKKQFQDRLVEKRYLALVYGSVSKDRDSIDFPLKRASTGHRQAAVPSGWDDIEDAGSLKEALTEFDVLDRYVNHTLLSVRIKSGRKHQIRVHFYAYGNPLVGDDLYGTRTTKSLNKKMTLGRIFLVSCRLAFKDASGVHREFELEPPEELKAFLRSLPKKIPA